MPANAMAPSVGGAGQAPHFPQLVQLQLRPRGITGRSWTGRSSWTRAGSLDVPEPVEAANHLFALTMGQMNNRTMYGAIPLDDAEITRMATSGARAFLRAYRPR